ncbi:fumarate reductase, flavoprotein subunit precursor [Lactiplantibacillus plantarum]|uniref:FAD-dependent oxidoreductase n=1 Tax=Lactiplantibacillus plantarum TaxID=1590 RepID=UPI0013E8DC74|nr:FAD-dependent oxidoreductase [Lactiplantibacillus plantarum]MCG0638086.1 fumarate reductase, flavoprotein subunit precursor [Lactiplantibacillus plantarum]MCG0647368.1 fumarate reductase, flavoprotein subunit precursor [Lactiplantibacillus plantarum]MCG0801737.1 fumarate reductase, flavoprotein subunit precursor [Lactiplantibacillus plantarum]MCG0848435.1 fumarate reductase, flavoprotein subunit precursor [Lactiplantibacillus plantarum]MCG0860622.1 fumarate reductase, flavoprotein subunit p
MNYSNTLAWDAKYDVIVIGFGGAGATAARYAAKQDNRVLLIDAAPEGSEGGNTRFAAGAFATAVDFDKAKDYYLQSFAPFDHDEDTLNSFIHEIMQLTHYAETDFGLQAHPSGMHKRSEYYEFNNADGMLHQSMTTLYDGSFWKLLRQGVYDQLDKIDVWYDSPAQHLIQDPVTNTILGVQIEHKGQLRNIAAKNGVVMSSGGYENNPEMVQTYLGRGALAPIGTLYNQGKGIDLAVEAGARLWHMSNFDSHAFSLNEGQAHEQFAYMIQWKSLFTGSVFIAGDDGTRYLNEQCEDRHGYQYNHGDYVMLPNQNHPHIVMDQAEYDQLQRDTSPKADQIKQVITHAVQAPTLTALAEKIQAPRLTQAVADFNFFVTQGRDYVADRPVETMRQFSDGPYYAIPIRHNILHTHGGARRNGQCEVLDLQGHVIPHLYEAGELGDPFATKYIGGSSVADLLVSGRLAGLNAAKPKDAAIALDAITSPSRTGADLHSDATKATPTFETAANQYVGIANQGMGDLPIAVRVTVDDQHITDIETLQAAETPSIGGQAIPQLRQAMLRANSYDVDVISGASATSKGYRNAVKNALAQVKS